MEQEVEFTSKENNEYIGRCLMQEDGTLVLTLRAAGSGGLVGHGTIEYKKDHPSYKEVLSHVGPIEPGESKPVLPFPEDD
ncbi:hypothetical protein GC174_03875 [bacterium]|nr:hypothetical protein [bacterium]